MAVIEPTTVVLVLLTVGSVAIGLFAWQQRPKPGSTTLAILLWSIGFWTASIVAAALTSGYLLARITTNLTILATAVTSAAFFAFALEYTGREGYLRWPYPLALAAEPALVAALSFTNDLHGFFWEDVFRNPGHYSGFEHVAGLGQWGHIVYTYLLTLVGIYLVARKLLRSRAVHRSQTAAVLIAAAAPLVGNVLYMTDILPIGQIVGFAVTGAALYWAVARGKLIDLTPVARATVLEELEMGVIVIDTDGRIIDSNPYARRLLGIHDESSVIGQPLAAVLEDRRELIGTYAGSGAIQDTIEVTIGGEDRQLSIKASPLRDNLDREIGRLFLFEDVTDERRRRAEIERQNERLHQFASMVSHDLRNPLDVASGYVELMRQSRAEAVDGTRIEVDKLDETADALGRIEAIVDDVLTLAREGEAATDPETVSLRSAARAAWDHVATGDAQIVIGTDAMVVADREKLERVFENLFRNAVEHAGRGVTVSVGTFSEDGTIRGFYVEDDGRGIPEHLQDSILESGVTDSEGGTGFGLAIVDQLTSAHDWSVEVTDSDEGGARFEFRDVTCTTESVPAERQPS